MFALLTTRVFSLSILSLHQLCCAICMHTHCILVVELPVIAYIPEIKLPNVWRFFAVPTVGYGYGRLQSATHTASCLYSTTAVGLSTLTFFCCVHHQTFGSLISGIIISLCFSLLCMRLSYFIKYIWLIWFDWLIRRLAGCPRTAGRRRPGRTWHVGARHTWLRTVNADLHPLNHGLNSAWRLAQDRERWTQLVGTATLQRPSLGLARHDDSRRAYRPYTG